MRTFFADLLRSGRSQNGTVYSTEALNSLLPLVAGTPIRSYGSGNHAKNEGLTDRGRALVTRNTVGFLGPGPYLSRLPDGSTVLRAQVVLDDPQSERLIDAARAAGTTLGLSIDAIGLTVTDATGRQECARIESLREATLVAKPAAARGFAETAARNGALTLVRTFIARGKRPEALLLLDAIAASLEASERTGMTSLLRAGDMASLRRIAQHLAADEEPQALAILAQLEDEVAARALTSDPPPLGYDPQAGPSMSIGEAWDCAAAALEALQSQARLACHRINSSDWSRYQAGKQVTELARQARRARNLARAARAVERAKEWAATCPEHRVQEAVSKLRAAEATFAAERRAC